MSQIEKKKKRMIKFDTFQDFLDELGNKGYNGIKGIVSLWMKENKIKPNDKIPEDWAIEEDY